MLHELAFMHLMATAFRCTIGIGAVFAHWPYFVASRAGARDM